MRTALITGITGQDGSYLAELLLDKGYEVHGIIRRASNFNTQRIDHIFERLTLHYGDVTDALALRLTIEHIQPDEIYNLAAQSHVAVSFSLPVYTSGATGQGALNVFECVRQVNPKIKIYQAGSSEMYGNAPAPQGDLTQFKPRSPYAVAKVLAHHLAINYREAYGMFICNGVLFNHESPRRGETFVTRKITRGLTRIKCGLQEKIVLGNISAKRDWGHAKDYVRAMWLMLQQRKARDYVIGMAEAHSVADFLATAGDVLGLDWTQIVSFDARYQRPTDVQHLEADPTFARYLLKWEPEYTFATLVEEMCNYDSALAEREARELVHA